MYSAMCYRHDKKWRREYSRLKKAWEDTYSNQQIAEYVDQHGDTLGLIGRITNHNDKGCLACRREKKINHSPNCRWHKDSHICDCGAFYI